MPDYLQWLARILPLTYAVDGLRDIMVAGKNLLDVRVDLAVLVGFAIVISVVTAVTLRRGSVS